MKKIPSKNQSQEINQEGLIQIDYRIEKSRITVEMFYEGGITWIEFIKQPDKIIRKIIYSPD